MSRDLWHTTLVLTQKIAARFFAAGQKRPSWCGDLRELSHAVSDREVFPMPVLYLYATLLFVDSRQNSKTPRITTALAVRLGIKAAARE